MNRWPAVPLREVLKVSKERIEPKEHPEKMFNYVGLENIEGHTGRLLAYELTMGAHIKSTKNIFRSGQILYGKLRPYLNKVYLAQQDGICSTDIYVLEPQKDRIIPSLAAYILRSQSVLEETSNVMVGANLPRINESNLLGISVRLPPLVEQERIVKLLDEAEELRKLRFQADRRTTSLVPALFHEVFGATIEKSQPGLFKPLGEVCNKITDGVHLTPTYIDEGVPFLRVTDVQTPEINWAKVKKIPQDEYDQITRRVKAQRGDVLYSKNGTIGFAKEVTWENPFTFFVSLALLKPHHELLNPTFLTTYLNTTDALQQALGHSKTGTVTNLHLNEIRKIKIPCPPIEMQESFVELVAKIRALEADQSQNRGRLDDLHQSLLHNAFTGEV